MSFIARNTSSSSESRLTVTRDRPASRSGRALAASSVPLVVRARSLIPSTAASMATSRSRSRRTSGSPPVSRTLVTPRAAAAPTTRVISSNDRISARGRRRGRGQTPSWACSTGSGSCTGRSPRRAGPAADGRGGLPPHRRLAPSRNDSDRPQPPAHDLAPRHLPSRRDRSPRPPPPQPAIRPLTGHRRRTRATARTGAALHRDMEDMSRRLAGAAGQSR